MGEWVDFRFRFGVGWDAACSFMTISIGSITAGVFQLYVMSRQRRERERTQTSKGIDPVNIHSAATTNSLPATPPERQGGINFVLNPDQRVQHHGSSLV